MSQASQKSTRTLPPMLTQYLEYKEEYPDCLLLFQVGDFYEAFFDDAVKISKTLNLTLTSRDKNAEDPIPMSGVPIAAVEGYLDRLVDQNISVALVSQKATSNGKAAVDRYLERIVTPGVQVLGNSDSANDSLVASICLQYVDDLNGFSDQQIALACCYPASATVKVYENLDRDSLLLKISQLLPAEIILPRQIENKQLDRRLGLLRELENVSKNTLLRFRSEESNASKNKKREFINISGYASLGNQARTAGRLLVNYLDEITVERGIQISEFDNTSFDDALVIDASTRQNLELVQNLKTGAKDGSLYAYLDHTSTLGGSRLLKQWILNPSANLSEIEKRQASVIDLLNNEALIRQLQKLLSLISDLERAAARLELNVINPRELAAVRDGLLQAKQINQVLRKFQNFTSGGHLAEFTDNFSYPEKLLEILLTALEDEPASSLKLGPVFRSSYNQELDRLRNLTANGKNLIKELEERERNVTGISSLKIKFNNVHNYFIEVTKTNLSKVPESYIKKQSTVNYERFYTPELKELEEDLLSAEGKQFALEKELYEDLKQKAVPFAQELRIFYQKIALIDVLNCFADLSQKEGLVKPEIRESGVFYVKSGRHPVLSRILLGDFVPNDISLCSTEKSCLILTGPNMGGKSTYLRQNALIVIMAQIGCFVSAEECKLGIVDRIFARIGASDDQVEGDSTFMVEMREAAQIISCSTSKSLVLIDELGRGTSTTDGRALAQAVLEWIITEKKARTLFATHFHSLTELANQYDAAINYSVGSVDINGQVIFTHEICEGPANKSYGLEVAKLAGLPEDLIARAHSLVNLAPQEKLVSQTNQLPLFQTKEPVVKKEELKELESLRQLNSDLAALDIDEISPRQALEILYNLLERNTQISCK